MSREDLVEKGRKSYLWARQNMLAVRLAQDYVRKKGVSLEGLRLAGSLHVSKETAVFLLSLKTFGVEIELCAANPLSSQEDIVSFLSSEGVKVRASRGESVDEYRNSIESLVRSSPDLIVDDGGELHVAYGNSSISTCFAGSDETTSGTLRLVALESAGKLRYPVITVNEAKTKYLFDNRYGTGQSCLDGLLRSTGLLIAGKTIVVAGYGWVGKGVALRAKGLGARVIVTEIYSLRAVEAYLDGYEVMRMEKAAAVGDIFLTCTGQTDVLSMKHFLRMKDGAILGNCGHFDREINVKSLKEISNSVETVRENVQKFRVRKKFLYLLCEGRVVNLVAAEGHPPEIMQFSFAVQLLSLHYLVSRRKELAKSKMKVLGVPEEIDHMVAEFALKSFQLEIDKLDAKQRRYASTFNR